MVQLRNSITQPTQPKEKVYPSHGISSLSSKAKRLMQPQYPSLPESTVIKSLSNPSPAAFPSRSLTQTPFKASDRQTQSRGDLQQDSVHGSEERVSPLSQDHGLEPNNLSENSHSNLDETIDDIKTCPLRDDGLLVVSPVEWNLLEGGIQLYIFNSLRYQYKQTELVAKMLGLGTTDLRDLLLLRNLRATHPLHTHQLWQHCLYLSEGTSQYVDPRILDQYMTYFTFTDSFETASIYQRQLAKSFLSQQGIVGPWVDALLRDGCGIWNRPEGPSTISERSEFGFDDSHASPTSFSEVWWQITPQGTHIQEFHGRCRPVSYIENPYFPASVRDELVNKGTSQECSCESWLIHALSDSGQDELQPTIEESPTGALKPPSIHPQPILQLLKSLIRENAPAFSLHQACIEYHYTPLLYIYAATRLLAQAKLIKKEVESMPFTRDEKLNMLKTAKAQCESKLLRDIEGKIPLQTLPTPQLRSSSSSSLESSTLVDDEAMQAITGSDNAPELFPTSPIEPSHRSSSLDKNVNWGQEDVTNPLLLDKELPRPSNRRKGGTPSKSVTLLTPNSSQYHPRLLASSVQPGLADVTYVWQGRHRSSSIGPCHTARNLDKAVAMVITPQPSSQTGRKSPTPPPWSPMSDIDASSKSLSQATTTPKN